MSILSRFQSALPAATQEKPSWNELGLQLTNMQGFVGITLFAGLRHPHLAHRVSAGAMSLRDATIGEALHEAASQYLADNADACEWQEQVKVRGELATKIEEAKTKASAHEARSLALVQGKAEPVEMDRTTAAVNEKRQGQAAQQEAEALQAMLLTIEASVSSVQPRLYREQRSAVAERLKAFKADAAAKLNAIAIKMSELAIAEAGGIDQLAMLANIRDDHDAPFIDKHVSVPKR